MARSEKYEDSRQGLLSHDDDTASEDSETNLLHREARCKSRSQRGRVILIGSILLNLILVVILFVRPFATSVSEKSKFAQLSRNVPQTWGPNDAGNATEDDALWDMTTYDLGNIALSDDEAKELGLPRAQRWPWDRTKGIYLINAYHNLHCVAMLRKALMELRTGQELSSPWAHTTHCLLVLREEVMCNADDVPRYTGFQPGTKSGIGQVRMCRDWSKLEEWAREKTACWKHVGSDKEEGFRELDRYRFCPAGHESEQVSQTKWLGDSDWWKKYQDPANDNRLARPEDVAGLE